jgi:hypothetical protein
MQSAIQRFAKELVEAHDRRELRRQSALLALVFPAEVAWRQQLGGCLSRMEREPKDDWRSKLQRIMPVLPNDYAQAKQVALELSRVFHEELGKAFAPRLNTQLRKMPTHNLEDCRKIAAFCNAELDDLHLRIRCPNTGLGAILVCDTHSQEYDAPRFRLQMRTEGHLRRTVSWSELPKLELVQDHVQLNRSRSGQARSR